MMTLWQYVLRSSLNERTCILLEACRLRGSLFKRSRTGPQHVFTAVTVNASFITSTTVSTNVDWECDSKERRETEFKCLAVHLINLRNSCHVYDCHKRWLFFICLTLSCQLNIAQSSLKDLCPFILDEKFHICPWLENFLSHQKSPVSYWIFFGVKLSQSKNSFCSCNLWKFSIWVLCYNTNTSKRICILSREFSFILIKDGTLLVVKWTL